MFRSWKVGTAFGIPLYVHPTFLLLPAWVLFNFPAAGAAGFLFLLLWVAAIFACVLLHELGHALTARRFGIATHDITLYPIGGVARLARMSERPEQELCIALAGPAVNVVIAALLTPVALLAFLSGLPAGGNLGLNLDHGPLALLATFLTLVWCSNVLLVLFNLLPAFPMDGGRVFRALLSLRLGHLRATEVAAKVGLVMAGLLACVAVFWAHNPMMVVLALFVCFAGQQELWAVRRRAARQRAVILEPVPEAISVFPEGNEPFGRPPSTFPVWVWDPQFRVWVRCPDGRTVRGYRGAE
jgi:Zn-dependent protease